MKYFRYILALILMIMLFIGCNYAAYSIPQKSVRENALRSMTDIVDEGIHWRLFDVLMMQKDNVTDGLMYNMAICYDQEEPFRESVLNPRITTESRTDTVILPAANMLRMIDGDSKGLFRENYSRYWHGYMLPLKVWSVFLDIHGIRLINSLLLWGLFALSALGVWRGCGRRAGVAYVVAVMLLGFPVVTLSFQFYACYYIMFLTVLWLSSGNRWDGSVGNLAFMFFIVGGVTAYIDYFTYPMLTLTVPLLLLELRRERYATLAGVRLCVLGILTWCLGYGGIWSSKWLISQLVTGESVFANACGSMQYSVVGPIDFSELMAYKHIKIEIVSLVTTLAATLTLWLTAYRRDLRHALVLLFIALIPFGWLCAVHYHTLHHFWFTYRALTAPALLCIYSLTILWKPIRR